jgi:Tfp pilus assembly protein PilF
MTGSPDAIGQWAKLGDARPDDLAVQRAALKSPAAAVNPEFFGRTIERLRKLTGDNGMEWRLARLTAMLDATPPPPDQLSQASEWLDATLRENPASAEAHFLKARVLSAQSDPAGAKRHLLAASNLDPASPRIAISLVPILSDVGDAVELKRRLLCAADGPSPTPELWAALGWAYEKEGSAVRAEASYRRALKLRPNLAVVKNNLAMLLVNSQSASGLQEAVELASAATAAQPKNASYLDTLALAQARSGNLPDALHSVAAAIALAPKDTGLRLNQIEWLISAGRADEARTSLEVLQQLSGAQRDEAGAHDRLAAIRSALASKP